MNIDENKSSYSSVVDTSDSKANNKNYVSHRPGSSFL